ncbi:MAG: HDOD domain-containing protein [Sulfurospirillum sp.]
MLHKHDIDKYLNSIPPIPQTIKSTLAYLDSSDMIQAANIAKEDSAFVEYLSRVVNKPIFGFRDEIKNVNQIFGILGLNRAKQVIYSYYMQIILPHDWEVFDFTSRKFQDLQANLMIQWSRILNALKIQDRDLEHSITLIPASLIVCEMLFRDIKDTISILRETKEITYDEILYKMSGYRLLDVVEQIAKKWDFKKSVTAFVKSAIDGKSKRKPDVYLRLLLAYEMSKPYIIRSGLNDFFDFSQSFKEEEIIKFQNMIEMDI